MKTLIQVPLSSFSGYGQDGRGITNAFLKAGVDLHILPTVVQPPIDQAQANLLTKPSKAPFDMILTQIDPGAMSSDEQMKKSTDLLVGWTMWEFETLRNLRGFSKLKQKLKFYDVLVAYDEVTKGALTEFFDGPIIVQQGGYLHEEWGYDNDRRWDTDEFYMFMVGQLSERKNPFAAVQAFNELQHQDSEFGKWGRLSLKTTAPGLHSRMEDVYPGLRVFYEVWPQSLIKEFYSVQHLLLAPSWGEGKNMPALEFMTTGGAVAATNWGGMAQWLNPDYSYPLEYDIDTPPWDEKARAAKVRIESLKETMLHCFRNRDEVRQKGLIASQVIPQTHDWSNVIDKLIEKLDRQFPEQGLLAKYTISKVEASRASS